MNINEYIGMPWKKGGKTPGEGFDCWGFFAYFYKKEMGVTFKKQYPYLPGETRKITKAFKEAIETENWVQLDKPENGCAVALSQNNKIHHVGVWYSGGCIHAVKDFGVVFHTLFHLKQNGYNKIEYYAYKK